MKMNSSLQILLTFLTLILIGSVLLYYFGFEPNSSRQDYLTAIFISTSAVCVTGLSTIDIPKELTGTGQIILLILIQLGGLGIVTLSNWFLLTFKGKLNLSQTSSTRELYGRLSMLPIRKILQYVVYYTVAIEFIGIILLYFAFRADYPDNIALWYALFNSISAFCNAGFSLFSDSLMSYQSNWFVNCVIIFEITAGGIGFLVATDLFENLINRIKNRRLKLSLQTKVVLLISALLIVIPTLLFMLFEAQNLFSGDSIFQNFVNSLFLSVTARTAGFNTIATDQLRNFSLILLMFLMVVGGSSGSTAGGIKTNTLAIFWAMMVSSYKGRGYTGFLNRSISYSVVSKAILVIVYYLLTAIVAVIALEFLELRNIPLSSARELFLPHFFEVISALSTVGLSLGITTTLSHGGQIVIIVCMIAGRVGPLALATSVLGERKAKAYRFAEEDILVG